MVLIYAWYSYSCSIKTLLKRSVPKALAYRMAYRDRHTISQSLILAQHPRSLGNIRTLPLNVLPPPNLSPSSIVPNQIPARSSPNPSSADVFILLLQLWFISFQLSITCFTSYYAVTPCGPQSHHSLLYNLNNHVHVSTHSS